MAPHDFSLRTLDVLPLDLPLKAPFGIARGEQAVAANLLLRLELDDGTVGLGEAAPFPAYNGETRAAAREALLEMMPELMGRRFEGWRACALACRERLSRSSGSALAALEMALLDALARRMGCPLWSWFGGAEAELEIDYTITTGSSEEAAVTAGQATAAGFRILKVKVGGRAGVRHDVDRFRAIGEAAPGVRLIVDANASLTRAEARELLEGLRLLPLRPVLLEQWLAKDDLDGMAALTAEAGIPVAADESVATAADAFRIARLKAANYLNIKLMKAGLLEAMEVAAVARAAGLGLMIGGNVESGLAMAVAAGFAAGQGGFHFADLDTPLFLAESPFEGGYLPEPPWLRIDTASPGHGVRLAGALPADSA
ncbi:MAG: dipeptide epimerase [Puniceicoccaceae bacterium]|nr:MAG: dipeptide epimerase [Puniceicoccaceae bacterium]